MSEWKETKLQKIVAIQNGCAFKSEDFDTQGVPVIKIKNIASGKMIWDDIQFYSKSLTGLDKFIIRYNDILISMTGSHVTQISSAVGKVTRYSSINQSLLNQRVGKIYSLNSNHLNNDFLYYFLIQPTIQYQLGLSASGSANQANISPSNIKELSILLPSLSEQKQIADVLSCLDAKIENLSRQNETLEQISRSLFKHWFIDFEFPDANGKPYKSSGGAMIASELGDIPKDWKVGNFGDIVVNFDRQRIPLSSNERQKRQGIYPYYGATSIMDYVDDYLFDGLYILMGEDGTVIDDQGYPVLQYVFGKFWVNNHAHVLQGKNEYSSNFIYLFLKRTKINNIVTGAVQPKINQANMNGIKLVIPKGEQVKLFDLIINPILEKKKINISQIQTLTKTRDSLLPKLMSGQLRVKE